MALDTLPMPQMFEACRQVLFSTLIPMHYVGLTETALGSLGLSRRDVNWQRQIEDVREKMLKAGQYDTFYTGMPDCLAGMRWWFESKQLRILHPTCGVLIPGNASSGVKGAFEALMRDPYMKIKTGAPTVRRAQGRANGLVIEKHVADWFKAKWPDFYLPPDNEGKWKQYCDHDFKLNINGSILKIDVTGRKLNGTYGNPGQGKSRVDLHLVCEIIGPDVLWKSVYTGKDYNGIIFPDTGGIYPERMIVWLNCMQAGIDYESVKAVATQKDLIRNS